MILFSVICSFYFLNTQQFKSFGDSIIATVFFVSNIFFYNTIDYFEPAAETKPLLHMWSLSVEEQFYFIFPIFLLVIGFWRRKISSYSIVIFVMFLASLAYSITLHDTDPDANYYGIFSRAYELLLGSIGAVALIAFPHLKQSSLIALIGLGMIVYSIFSFDNSTPFPSSNALIPAVGTLLIILFARKGNFLARFLSLKIFVWFGSISYSLYLYHQPIFAFARIRSFDQPSNWLMICLICLSISLAYLSFRYIETPFRKSNVLRGQLVLTMGVTGTAFFIGFAALTKYEHISPYLNIDTLKQLETLKAEKAAVSKISLDNVCHHRRPKSLAATKKYLKEWECTPNRVNILSGDKLSPTKIFVVGDSHGRDIANGIRLNGLAIYQITANAMPINKKDISTRRWSYTKTLNFARDKIRQLKPDVILLVHRADVGNSLGLPMKRFWGEFSDKVFILSSRPEYPDFSEKLLHNARYSENKHIEMNLTRYNYSQRGRFKKIYKESGFNLIDQKKLYCNEGTCSPFLNNGNLRIIDYGHLSVGGARELGLNLLKEICSKIPQQSFCKYVRYKK